MDHHHHLTTTVASLSDHHYQPSLVGRDDEVQSLLQAYQRSVVQKNSVSSSSDHYSAASVADAFCHNNNTGKACCELVLIRGKSGTGKTAVANSLRSIVLQDDGYFLSGKFELTNTLATPYAVFVSAFTQFTDQLLETNSKDERRLSKMRQVIRDVIGMEGKLLIGIIPALERIIGTQQEEHDESESHGPEALRRFQFLFCQLCLAVSTVAPIVLFLDDLQWSDQASLQLLQAMLQSRRDHHSENSSLLLVGAYRNNVDSNNNKPTTADAVVNNSHEPSSTATFLERLHEMHTIMAEFSVNVNITNIHLQNLNEAAMNELVADVLDIPVESTTEIGQAIFSACHGNPLHAVQILNDLLRKSFDASYKLDGNLQWSDPRILQNAKTWAESIDELFRRKFMLLPNRSQSVLQVAACMGDEMDEQALAMVLDMELPDIVSSIQSASDDGHCVFDAHRGRYGFAHDRMRHAALSTIRDKNATFFQIGYKLWTKSSPLFLSTNKFMVAHLLNHGLTMMITDQVDRNNAAAFNLEVGIEAASKADFPDSSRFLRAGIEFLKAGGCDHWTEQYALSLKLFNAAIDTEVCIQNFDRVQELVEETLEHARSSSLQDKLTAHIAAINSFGQRGLIPDAVAVGIDVLRQLDEQLPQSATKLAIIWDVLKTKLALRGRSNDDLLRLHPMNDTDKLAAMHVLTILLPYTYQAASFYTPLLGARLVRMCLKYGMHKNCAFGFVTFGMIICGRDRKEGYRFGSLALSIVQRWRARALLPRVHTLFYGLIHHWQYPLRTSLEPLQNAIQVAFETGDVEAAMIARYYQCSNWLHSGMNLAESEKLLVESTHQMRIYKQDNLLQFTTVLLQYVQTLTGTGCCDPNAAFTEEIVSDHVPVKATYYVWGTYLAFRFGNYDQANKLAELANSVNFKPFAQYGFSVRIQTEALLAVARARRGNMSTRSAYKMCKFVWKKMKAFEADCSENFSFKRAMVEAELRSLKTRDNRSACTKITHLYDQAIQDALAQGFTHEAALASELAGDYLNRQGYATAAKNRYWEHAYRLYVTWGAMNKAEQLISRTGLRDFETAPLESPPCSFK